MTKLKTIFVVASLTMLLSAPVNAQFGGGFGNGGGNNAGGNGNGNANGLGNGGGNGGGNGNGNNGNGGGNGGPGGVPLPLLGSTALGHAALLGGGYLVWRRRKWRFKTTRTQKQSAAH